MRQFWLLNYHFLILRNSFYQLSNLFIPFLDLILQLYSTLSVSITLLTKHLLHLKYLNSQSVSLLLESLDFSILSLSILPLFLNKPINLVNLSMLDFQHHLPMLILNLLPTRCCLLRPHLHLLSNLVSFSLSSQKLLL